MSDSNGSAAGTGPSGPNRPWPAVGPIRRFAPTLLLVVALVAAGTIATVSDHSATGGAASSTSTTSASPANLLPVTYPMAKKAGTTAKYHWQTGCDFATGRVGMPTVYAPPCVPAFSGPNGGSTWNGLTATTINVVLYQSPPGDLTSALPNASDPSAEVVATAKKAAAIFNSVYELYGRKVKIIPFTGSGISTDAVAARADAIKVATQLHAFASLGGPAQTASYENELAKEHVLCIGCGLSVPYSTFQADSPYLWDNSPDPDTLLTEAFDFIIGQLHNKNAIYAGNPAFHHERRVFGVVHYDQNPPVFGSLTARLYKEFAHMGFHSKVSLSYILDLSTLPQEAATIVTKLKAAGITTVIFAGDPIMPIYLTKAAAAQDYYPEWVITGTVFTDSSTLGRLYDQSEWAHAFGVSPGAVLTPIQWSLAWKIFRWWSGTKPPAPKTGSGVVASMMQLYTGMQLAGPKLTPQTFEGGMWDYPPSGGGPTSPLIAYGPNGAPPRPAYSAPDDYTIIWYDANATGADEEGVVGKGLIRYVDGGKRYKGGVIPRSPIPLFNDAHTVLGFKVPPELHSAPPFPGSPMAKRSSP